MLAPEDAPRVVSYLVRNRAHLGPWDDPRPPGFFTEEHWREQIPRNHREFLEDRSLRFFLVSRGDPAGPLVGTLNFSAFERGRFQCCRLGYGLDAGAEGRGLMSEAIRAATSHVFSVLGFHRIEANYVVGNARSGRTLERCGFTVEGVAARYLFVGDAWRDHVRTSLTNPDPVPPPV